MKDHHLLYQGCHPGPNIEYLDLYLSNYWVRLFGTSICKGRSSNRICLLTCLAICAIHLELIRSLSDEHFLQWLRRGRRETIISDNIAQFKLVKTVVDEQWRQIALHDKVVTYLSSNGIKWHFTTALAPWK